MKPPKPLRVLFGLAAITVLTCGVLWNAARRAWKDRATAGDLDQERRRLADGDAISQIEAAMRRHAAGMPLGHPEVPGHPSAAEVAVYGAAYEHFARQLAGIRAAGQ